LIFLAYQASEGNRVIREFFPNVGVFRIGPGFGFEHRILSTSLQRQTNLARVKSTAINLPIHHSWR